MAMMMITLLSLFSQSSYSCCSAAIIIVVVIIIIITTIVVSGLQEFDSRGTRTPWHLPKQPSLDFTAPELVAGVATSPNSDMFSLGALIYELYSGHPLLQSNGNILTYKMEIENMARAGECKSARKQARQAGR